MTLPQLLVARAIAGGMTAAIVPLTMAWIGDVIPYEERQPVLARFLVGMILGTSVAQLLGGLSADHFGRRVPFFIIAVLFVASAALLLSTRRSLPARALAGQPVSGHPLQRFWREFALVIAEPHVRTVLLTVFLEGATVFGAFAFFAAHVHHELGLPLTSAGMVVMLVGIGGLLFAVASRKLVGRLGESGLVALSCLSMGVGFYMFHNTLQTHATQMAPARRGTAVAAFALCFFLGQSVGVSLAGWLIGRFGSRAALIGAAAAILLVTANFHRKIRHL
jgi:predicted MFS family arabinose efflux permease